MDVETCAIDLAALHVYADAIRLRNRTELTHSERARVEKAINILSGVRSSVQKREASK